MPCAACTGRRAARCHGALAGTHHSAARDVGRVHRVSARTARATIRAASTGGCSRAAIAPTSGSPPIARCCRRRSCSTRRRRWRFPSRRATSGSARARSPSGSPRWCTRDGDPVGVAVHDDRGQMRIAAAAHAARRGWRDRARRSTRREPERATPLAPARRARCARRAIAIITDLLGDADELLRVARVHIVGRRRSASRARRRARGARSAAPTDARRRSRATDAATFARRSDAARLRARVRRMARRDGACSGAPPARRTSKS